MSIKIVNYAPPAAKDEAELHRLYRGTLVTNIPGHADSFYIKVDKYKTGADISLYSTSGDCILLNIKTGQLRSVKGGTVVKVLNGHLNVSAAEATDYTNWRLD